MATPPTTTLQERHPELFAVDKLTDPRLRHRVVDMEILALGMSRTGTASMQAALQILGYNPTYHGFSMFYNIRDVDMWTEALQAKFFPEETSIKPFKKEDFDQLLGEYRAVCDMPSITFAAELMTAYPNAKVVLVERDIEAWYRSFDEAVIKNSFNPVARFISSLDTEYLARMDKMLRMQLRGQFRSTTKKQLMDNARPVYREH